MGKHATLIDVCISEVEGNSIAIQTVDSEMRTHRDITYLAHHLGGLVDQTMLNQLIDELLTWAVGNGYARLWRRAARDNGIMCHCSAWSRDRCVTVAAAWHRYRAQAPKGRQR